MTLAMVRRRTARIREFSALPFLLLAGVSLLGAVVPAAAPDRLNRGLLERLQLARLYREPPEHGGRYRPDARRHPHVRSVEPS